MGERLRGKVAVITGAASGIGAETARVFVANGARVVVADLQEEPAQELVAELGEAARFARPAARGACPPSPRSLLDPNRLIGRCQERT